MKNIRWEHRISICLFKHLTLFLRFSKGDMSHFFKIILPKSLRDGKLVSIIQYVCAFLYYSTAFYIVN